MKLYKLTRKDGTSYNGCKWGPGVTHETNGKGELCGPGYTHWYTHPLLAVFLNPIHADFNDPIMWEGEGEVAKEDHRLKVGCTKGTTIKQIPLPKVTREQRIRFGILCAKQVFQEEKWNKWADDWLAEKDRSASAAREAAQAAQAAARAARVEWAAARAAAAAWAASAAARAAARAAQAAPAAWAAAWAAAQAAAQAAKNKPLDLITIAEKAIRGKK